MSYAPIPPQGPYPVPPKKNRRWWPWVLGGCGCLFVAALAVVALIIGFVVFGTSGPREAVTAYKAAWDNADCSAFMDVTTAKFRDGITCEEFEDLASKSDNDVELSIYSTEVSGDRATVKGHAKGTNKGKKIDGDSTFELVKEDGDWKIDSVHFVDAKDG